MAVIVTKTVDEVRSLVKEWKRKGDTIGLVPTMGYLHEGHGSLIKRAVSENDKVIVSDFVNPIQFAPSEDLSTYPKDFDADRALCEELGADLIFAPEPSEMYKEDFSTHVDVSQITEGLCGKSRPTHFRGVCTVVSKLFHISGANRAYFGQKDAQQLAVVRRMVRDLNFDIQIIGCPIIREDDGLAKSSRNTYLDDKERKAATVLYRALSEGKNLLDGGERDTGVIVEKVQEIIESEPMAKVDYVELLRWDSLENLSLVDGPVLLAVAVYIGRTRLIDNIVYSD